ncbi:Laccase 1 [Operophtera brumata]|uniref:Laccase 1 n=1 Tax=Operophtera brumata TaxID=104452 RepID=A0A0L7LPK1_OPEBR|nr:Laccase 1 [Operophtera brumata]
MQEISIRVYFNINVINTQETSSIEATTEELLDAASVNNEKPESPLTSAIGFNEFKAARPGRSQNSSVDEVNLQTETVNPNETPSITHHITKPLESASRVIMPINANPVNEIMTPNKSKPESTKHRVKELKVEDIKTLIERNAHNMNNMRAHVQYDEVTGALIGGEHPCHRECREGELPMICYYHFNLEWYQTMSKACYNCPYNETDCSRPDCIPADGMNRPLNVVCQHDRVIVDVENDLMTEGTTVHWHGQHQRGTPFMDGTPYVTQCPILPETTFRSDHVMIVTDWIHELSVSMFSDHHHSRGDNKPPTLLINGVGRFRVFNNDTARPKYMKAARFNVEQVG